MADIVNLQPEDFAVLHAIAKWGCVSLIEVEIAVGLLMLQERTAEVIINGKQGLIYRGLVKTGNRPDTYLLTPAGKILSKIC